MNKFLILFFLVLIAKGVEAQTIETMSINGKDYFIYPFKVSIDPNSIYYRCMGDQPMKILYNEYTRSYTDLGMDVMPFPEFKKMVKKFRRRSKRKKYYYGYGSDSEKLDKAFIKAVRQNPYPLLEVRYSFEQDIIPSLDPIPDGDYVQLFERLCMIKHEGGCSTEDSLISGYFSMKDNMLDGFACWLNVKGDTLKSGYFSKGQRVGEWKLETRAVAYSFYEDDYNLYTERGYPNIDTTIIYQGFSSGYENGKYSYFHNSKYPIEEGFFKDGERVGDWVTRQPNEYFDGENYVYDRNNEVVTLRYSFADSEDTIVVKKPWIRDELYTPYDYDYEKFDFYEEYQLPDVYVDFFRLNTKEDEDLDLEDEEFMSYGEDEYAYEEYRYYDEYGYYSEGGPNWDFYDEEKDRYITKSELIDSLGLIANYKGIYEVKYPNGQLAFRYNFDSNSNLWEDTVFWSNGIPFDVIIFNADSNLYERSVYDVEGRLFETKIYDSLGTFVRFSVENDTYETKIIEGLEVHVYQYSREYNFYNYDTLLNNPIGNVILERIWDVDQNRLFNSEYHVEDRIKTEEYYSVLNTVPTKSEFTFGEDYTNWTGKSLTVFDNVEVLTTLSGSEYDYSNFMMYDLLGEEEDSIPERYIIENPYRSFEVASVSEVKLNGELYTGPVEISFGGKKITSSNNKLQMNFPYGDKATEYQEKVLARYYEKGKIKDVALLSYIGTDDGYYSVSSNVFSNIFGGVLGGYFYVPSNYEYLYTYEGEGGVESENNPVRVEGNMVGGRPHGIWKSFDKNGNVLTEVPYKEGEIDGTVKTYQFATPVDNTYSYEDDALQDTTPAKKTYYLESTIEYRNGNRHGLAQTYDWLGRINSIEHYEDDYLQGEVFERNKLAFSKANFRNGMLNGYMQTYLTLEDQDTMLLYDLNFKDGELQGESKAYHLNGKLAKRGFFLDGKPIEDYEAYDSLGFKYHYVKFQYSFPVEEKVWEENNLSVRYTFDWQDSIYFTPDDITSSQSLERLIFKLGLAGYRSMMPYTGRPTLVNKAGVNFHMTKYYPNDTIARDGELESGKKIGSWKFYDYYGKKLYEVDYRDSVIILNDSVKFNTKGVYTQLDENGKALFESYIIEKFEKYDCSHTDHYEVRQLITIWEAHDSLGRMNGYVKNYYDNGTIQSEGFMKNGLPDSLWKYYDPFGQLNKVGVYTLGKRNGRWLAGDLSKTKYLGDICLNPNLPDLEDEIKYRENLLDITISNYKMGRLINKQYYDIDMNRFIEDETEEEGLEEEN